MSASLTRRSSGVSGVPSASTEKLTRQFTSSASSCVAGWRTRTSPPTSGRGTARRASSSAYSSSRLSWTVGAELYALELRSEEHTSELQSHLNLVCRLLLEKKKKSSGNTRPLVTRHAVPRQVVITDLSPYPAKLATRVVGFTAPGNHDPPHHTKPADQRKTL